MALVRMGLSHVYSTLCPADRAYEGWPDLVFKGQFKELEPNFKGTNGTILLFSLISGSIKSTVQLISTSY